MTGWWVTSLSPTISTTQSSETYAPERTRRKAALAALSRDFIWPLPGLCREMSVSRALSASLSPAAKFPFPAGETGISVRARSGSILSLHWMEWRSCAVGGVP
jgi:hypothetical protein